MDTCKILSVKTYNTITPLLVITQVDDKDAIEQIVSAIIKIEHKYEDDIVYTKLEILDRATKLWFDKKPFFASKSYGYTYYLESNIQII